jgi:hypothetical protein
MSQAECAETDSRKSNDSQVDRISSRYDTTKYQHQQEELLWSNQSDQQFSEGLLLMTEFNISMKTLFS